MMHMPDDDNYRNLLADYMRPADDDGFSDIMMAEIAVQQSRSQTAKQALLRRLALYGAGFIGGMIAAVQLPKLMSLFQGVNMPDMPIAGFDLSSVALNPALMLVALGIGLVLWTALDHRAAEIF